MQPSDNSVKTSKPPSSNSWYNGVLSLIGMPMFFVFIALVILQGWLVRDYHLIVAETGLGYWLGIIGGILMLLLLLYPLRKHIASLHFLGPINILFRIHMIFGLLGPTLILLHSNFQLGALNSNVALFCMLIVAASGLAGRYLYFHIHHRITGRKLTIIGLQQESSKALTQLNLDLPHSHNLAEKIQRYEQEARQLDRGLLGVIRAPWLRAKCFMIYHLLWQDCKKVITENTSSQEHKKRLFWRTKNNLKIYFYCIRRLAQLELYEKTFSLWHVLHLPLFMLMLITGIFHVIAVHMY